MTESTLPGLADPMEIFARALGPASPDWGQVEDLHQISLYVERFERDAAAALDLEALTPLLTYGEALQCQFLSGRRPVLEIKPGLDQATLEEFRSLTAGTDVLILRFTLDKGLLLQEQLGATPAGIRAFLFLFPDALKRFLQETSLSELETALWGQSPGAKAMILVPKATLNLNGSHLAVLGGEALWEWQQITPPQQADSAAVEAAYQISQEALKWQAPWVQFLTPYHFQIGGLSGLEDPLASILRLHQANLTVLYLADRTVARDAGWVSTFAGAQQSVEIGLPTPGEVALDQSWEPKIEALFQLFTWAYEAPTAPFDRLAFVQIGVVQALQGLQPESRFLALITLARNIFQGVRWDWKTYIEGEIEDYVGQVQSLETLVSETVRAFSDQVSDLIKSLSDAMLAAVAVLIGSFIAALFQKDFNPTVFRIGLWVYAGYVGIFPLLYNMWNQWGRYHAMKEDFTARRRRFERRLSSERVNDILGDQFEASHRRFQGWYAGTLITYLVVIGLALLASLYLPALIQGSGPAPSVPATGLTPTSPYP